MKFFLATILLGLGLLVFVNQANAQLLQSDSKNNPSKFTQGLGAQAGYNIQVDQNTLSQRVGQIVKVILGFVGTIFAGLMIYAGFLWMTAGGNEDQVEKSKEIIKMAVIGLIITLGAYSITTFIIGTTIETSTQPAATAGSSQTCGEKAFGGYSWQRIAEIGYDLGKYFNCKYK